MTKSRSTASGCAKGVSGRDALEPPIGLEILEVGGVFGRGCVGAIGFAFDSRNISACRGDLSVNISNFVNEVFLANV